MVKNKVNTFMQEIRPILGIVLVYIVILLIICFASSNEVQCRIVSSNEVQCRIDACENIGMEYKIINDNTFCVDNNNELYIAEFNCTKSQILHPNCEVTLYTISLGGYE
jgi:hypothetical protein